jgi:phage baseplate assembly protein W
MLGMNRNTGKPLDGEAHLKQSIGDILTTPIGSRVMRRDYGSRIPALIDAPMNQAAKLDLFSAAAESLSKWEPRVKLDAVTLREVSEDGRMVLDLQGRNLVDGKLISIEGIVL